MTVRALTTLMALGALATTGWAQTPAAPASAAPASAAPTSAAPASAAPASAAPAAPASAAPASAAAGPYGAPAEPDTKAAEQALAAAGLPPFLAKMKRHDVGVKVTLEAGGVPAKGSLVGFTILAGGAKVKDYVLGLDAEGKALFHGIPSNPEVQSSLRYEVWVDHDGVRFPFAFDGVPVTGSVVEIVVPAVSPSLDSISIEHTFIELFPDEESLVVRHQLRLINQGKTAVNMGRLEGGGLKLPCPVGAKHPSLHDDHDPLLEVRGTDVWFTGALLPGKPAVISLFYSVPYDEPVFEWSQTLPVPSKVNVIVVPRDRQKGHQKAFPLGLETRGAFGTISDSNLEGGRSFQVLRAEGVTLEAGEALRFAVTDLPVPSRTSLIVLLLGIIGVVGIAIFGVRRSRSTGPTVSRGRIEAERDRLIRVLARMSKAHDKGRLSKVRFEREAEAISARLVSIYHALDRLEKG